MASQQSIIIIRRVLRNFSDQISDDDKRLLKEIQDKGESPMSRLDAAVVSQIVYDLCRLP